MTGEETERILKTAAGNLAPLTEAQIRFEAVQAQFDEVIKQVATSHQALIELFRVQEERIDGYNRWRDATDEKIDALINAQVKYGVRQERLEEAFRQVAESRLVLVQLASVHGERLEGHDNATVHTESRLDALIDAQIRLSHHTPVIRQNSNRLL